MRILLNNAEMFKSLSIVYQNSYKIVVSTGALYKQMDNICN